MADHSALIGPPPAPVGADHSALIGPPPAAVPPNGPSGYAADSTGTIPASPSMVQSLMNYAQKEGPPIAGGMIGGSLGAVGGPAGVMGGAALGGAAGRALQRDYQYATGSRDPNSDTASGNAFDIGKSGVAQGVSAGVGLGANAAIDAAAPGVGRVGAQLLRLANGTPVASGEAALGVPFAEGAPSTGLGLLGRALSPKKLGDAYAGFESANGVTGLRAAQEAAWQDNSASELKDMALSAAKKISSGQPIDNQEAYIASQAARKVAAQAANRDPDSISAMTSGLVDKAKGVIDTHLETAMPGYQALRQKAFESNVGQDFSTVLPQNQNMSPNVLRGIGGLSAAGYEGKKGNYGTAAGILAMMSPALAGLEIQGANAVAPAVAPAAGLALRAGAQSAADAMPMPAVLARILAARRAQGGQ
jgi:hypothetical protein